MRQGPARPGLETHVVEFAPRLMAVQVDDGGGRVLRQQDRGTGRDRAHAKNTVEIVDGRRHAPHAVRRRQPPGNRHDRLLGRHPPRDELARLRPGGGRRAAASPSTTLRHLRPGHLRHRRMRAVERQVFGLVAPGYDMARTPRAPAGREARASTAPT
jgi:nitrite reductase (NADH) large subunit